MAVGVVAPVGQLVSVVLLSSPAVPLSLFLQNCLCGMVATVTDKRGGPGRPDLLSRRAHQGIRVGDDRRRKRQITDLTQQQRDDGGSHDHGRRGSRGRPYAEGVADGAGRQVPDGRGQGLPASGGGAVRHTWRCRGLRGRGRWGSSPRSRAIGRSRRCCVPAGRFRGWTGSSRWACRPRSRAIGRSRRRGAHLSLSAGIAVVPDGEVRGPDSGQGSGQHTQFHDRPLYPLKGGCDPSEPTISAVSGGAATTTARVVIGGFSYRTMSVFR